MGDFRNGEDSLVITGIGLFLDAVDGLRRMCFRAKKAP